MKLRDWIKEQVEVIREASPIADFEMRECRFDVVVDGDGDVRLSGDTRLRFSLILLANVRVLPQAA